MRAPSPLDPPPPSALFLGWFARYTERYVAKHLHAVRLLGAPPSVPAERPLVIYLNHAAWWDPLICLLLARHGLAERTHYAPMEAAMLRRYAFLNRLGFFGLEPNRRGAAAFVQSARAILARPGATLWLTPQARFADPRERPPRFAAGLAHLARRFPEAVFLPLALEYPFWAERAPEALAHFGDPADDLETALAHTQDTLARAAIAQRAEDFTSLLRGAAGEGGIYQLWRRWRARWRGEAFQREHRA